MKKDVLVKIAKLCGKNVIGTFLLSIPLGVAQGVIEILLGLVLTYFLSTHHLIASVNQLPFWSNLQKMNSMHFLLIAGLLKATLLMIEKDTKLVSLGAP